jgi:hypothetical protein
MIKAGFIGYLFLALCLTSSQWLQAQVPPYPGPTSATDAGVKIHGHKKIFGKDKQAKTSSVAARYTEHQGEPMRKPRVTRPHQTESEVKTVKRQRHASKKTQRFQSSRQSKKQSTSRRDKAIRKNVRNISKAGAY